MYYSQQTLILANKSELVLPLPPRACSYGLNLLTQEIRADIQQLCLHQSVVQISSSPNGSTVLPRSSHTGFLQGVTSSGAALQKRAPDTRATSEARGTKPELVQHLKNTFTWTLGPQDQQIGATALLLLHSTNCQQPSTSPLPQHPGSSFVIGKRLPCKQQKTKICPIPQQFLPEEKTSLHAFNSYSTLMERFF